MKPSDQDFDGRNGVEGLERCHTGRFCRTVEEEEEGSSNLMQYAGSVRLKRTGCLRLKRTGSVLNVLVPS